MFPAKSLLNGSSKIKKWTSISGFQYAASAAYWGLIDFTAPSDNISASSISFLSRRSAAYD